jgi:hypothetical protein
MVSAHLPDMKSLRTGPICAVAGSQSILVQASISYVMARLACALARGYAAHARKKIGFIDE